MKKATQPEEASLIYVTRDIERALGGEPTGSYFILTNWSPYSQSIQKKYPHNVFLITKKTDNGDILDTIDLLKNGQEVINSLKGKIKILVFKNTNRIEELCFEKKWHLLNPKAALAEEIENKITQVKWLGSKKNEAQQYLPPHTIQKVSDIQLKSKKIPAPFMLQWAHSHTGEGTFYIGADKTGEKTLLTLREKFPQREARITAYVNGPVFTANICVFSDTVTMGNISSQITGTLPFTDNPWSTVGNDWSLPHSLLSSEKIDQFREIATAVGQRMIESGWRGLFGIDCIYDTERDNLHLIEVNARQPASTTYESQLQQKIKNLAPKHFENCHTLFEMHLAALQNEEISKNVIEISDGAQIILRILTLNELRKNEKDIQEIVQALREEKYTVIEYTNTKPGADLLRIQSDMDIMESQNKFNTRGKKILEIITGIKAGYDSI